MERTANDEVLQICTFATADMTEATVHASIIVAGNAFVHMGLSDRRKARRNLTDLLNPGGFILIDDKTNPLFDLPKMKVDRSFLAYRKPL